MQNVRALRSYAVYVVAYFGKTTIFKGAHLVFHEFFESVPGQLLIFDVVGFVFFCISKNKVVENFIPYKIALENFCHKLLCQGKYLLKILCNF